MTITKTYDGNMDSLWKEIQMPPALILKN
jgi:hypothetical protein